MTLHAGGVVHEGRTCNISRGGLCAVMDTMVPLGADIEVEIQLVFDDDMRTQPLRVDARVVWCTVVDDAHQIGVLFKRLDADKTELISLLLRYLDEGPVAKQVKGERSVDDRFR